MVKLRPLINTDFIGRRAEKAAADYLQRQGLVLLEKRYRKSLGEVDLIFLQANQLIFVEVKYRAAGLPAALCALQPTQKKRIKSAANLFLKDFPNYQHCLKRFDIVMLTKQTLRVSILKKTYWILTKRTDKLFQIAWLKRAF